MKKISCSKLIILIIVLSVTGCASIPQQVTLVNRDPELTTSITLGECVPDKFYQSDIGPVSSWQILDAKNISLLNWNIHKEKNENWSTDFLKHTTDQDIISCYRKHCSIRR